VDCLRLRPHLASGKGDRRAILYLAGSLVFVGRSGSKRRQLWSGLQTTAQLSSRILIECLGHSLGTAGKGEMYRHYYRGLAACFSGQG
jgi:hypothetical protein